MVKSLTKRVAKRVLRSVGLYPFLPRTLDEESAFWKATLPDWAAIVGSDPGRWRSARAAAAGGPRVLISTGRGGFAPTTIIDSLLVVALTLRRAQVHNLLCDKALPACIGPGIKHYGETEKFVKHGPSKLVCGKCFRPGQEMFRPLELPTHLYSELITPDESRKARELAMRVPVDEIPGYQFDGLATGEQAHAGALRFYMAGYLDHEPHGEAVLRHYFNAALLTAYAARRLLNMYPFDCVCFEHGIYVPDGVILAVARRQGLRTVSWSRAYRKNTFIFSHEDTYHHTLLSEPTSDWESMLWTREMEKEIMDYIKSRSYGTRDWISYNRNPSKDTPAIAGELGLDSSKPWIGLLTNVMGDGQVLFPSNAFPNMLEWVRQTVQYFAHRRDLQLVVRVHPAEIRGDRSRQPIVHEIRRAFPVLPDNVFIVPPEHPIDTYALMERCDTVIIYATKTGLELASMGIPVVVAGDSLVRNKGIALDASSQDEYLKLLDRLPLGEPLSDAVTQRARKFAYHFFFRRMIPLPFLELVHPAYKLSVSRLEDLMPGRSVGLDVMCNGILKGDKFIYPAELDPETDEAIHAKVLV